MCGINSADIDLAVRLGSLPDSSMVATRVGGVRRVVCGSPSYFSAHGIPRTPADLADLTCVTFANHLARARLGRSHRDRKISLRRRVQDAVLMSTRRRQRLMPRSPGLVLPTSCLIRSPNHREGKLRIVLTDYEPEPMPLHLAHAGQGLLLLKMRSFLEYAAPRLRKSPRKRPK